MAMTRDKESDRIALLARLGYETKENWRIPGQRRNKYGAVRSGGYDSKKEHRRALQLKVMQRAGLISGLREQVAYELIPAQQDALGNKVRPCSYVADFVYTDRNGREIVEDTKGVRTDAYKIKKKLMLRIYGITINEI